MELVSTQEAAAELGMSDRGIRLAIKEGRLDAVQVGRNYVIPRAALEKFKRDTPTRGRPRGSRNDAQKGKGKARGK